MSHILRTLSAALTLSVIAAGLMLAQPPEKDAKADETAAKLAADKAATDKAAAEKAAADKAAAEKAAADKAAAAKAATEKDAADKEAAEANPIALGNTRIYNESLAALTMLFVIAVLLENAFTVIFNWRVFLAYFSVRGIKTIVMIAVSWLIVNAFGIDVLASLIAAYKTPLDGTPIDPADLTGPASKFVTALILAGGSAGVNRIMNALGFRNERREEEVVPRPPQDKAWVAVRVKRVKAVGEIFVKIKDEGPAAGNVGDPTPIAGAVGLKPTRFAGLIFRDVNRFPQNGGYTVSPNVIYEITVEGKDAAGTVIRELGEKYVFAKGAIVDFEVTL